MGQRGILVATVSLLLIVGTWAIGPASAQSATEDLLAGVDLCLGIGQCTSADFDEDAEVYCQYVAQETTSCSREYDRLSMEYVIIKYCSADCDDKYVTTGSIHHDTWLDGDLATNWYNNYEDGVDLDPDNSDNTNNNCGEWHDEMAWEDDSTKMAGSISQDKAPASEGGCPTDPAHGYWFTGVDVDGD